MTLTLEPDPGNAGVGINGIFPSYVLRLHYPQPQDIYFEGGIFMNQSIKRITESAILIAIGTVLSLFTFMGFWQLGGGITFCSMLPPVMIAQRYGTRWGTLSAVLYGVLQCLLGLSNVNYAPDALTAIGIILLDYVFAFGALGFSACFNKMLSNRRLSIVLGIVFTMTVRFLCHFASGILIWEALWPNSAGWAPAIWSLAYNGSYMLPEILITSVVALVSFVPLKQYWLGVEGA